MLAVDGVVVLESGLLLTASPVGDLFDGPPLGPDHLTACDQVVRLTGELQLPTDGRSVGPASVSSKDHSVGRGVS